MRSRGHRCRHNLNYWQFGDYLGIGAGAHGKLSFPHRVMRQVRYREPRHVHGQRAGRATRVAQEDEVGRAELPFEFMLNALRLREGFALQRFIERTGLPLSAIERAAARGRGPRPASTRDLEPRSRPTARGFDFLNDLQELFLERARRAAGRTKKARPGRAFSHGGKRRRSGDAVRGRPGREPCTSRRSTVASVSSRNTPRAGP